MDYIITYNILFFRYDNSNNKENKGEKMKNKNLLNEMQKNDFRDKLIELGEEDFINWVENIAYKNFPFTEIKEEK